MATRFVLDRLHMSSGDRPSGSVAVLIAAGGRGVRFRGTKPKALELLAGEALLVHALRGVTAAPSVDHVVVAAPSDCVAEVRERATRAGFHDVIVVAGGVLRADSIAAAMAVLPDDVEIVLTHDAARPLAPAELFEAVIMSVRAGRAAVVPGLAVLDTVKRVHRRSTDGADVVEATIDRSSLRAIQTPQGFWRDVLEKAHSAGFAATDDAGLVELNGGTVTVIPGDPDALKITVPFDLLIAEAIVRARRIDGPSSTE